jgi:ribosomal protein S18 acetylase RimI-like enzyme
MTEQTITYRRSPVVSNQALSELYSLAWDKPGLMIDFQPVLQRSLGYICAYHQEQLIGYVNLAWDGGVHAFLLDTSVHPAFQRRGIGQELVRQAVALAQESGLEWVHVDYEPHLEKFYQGCGFQPTLAGLVRL